VVKKGKFHFGVSALHGIHYSISPHAVAEQKEVSIMFPVSQKKKHFRQ